ncbi:UNVERIFIED_CONTAM: hypothetical protein GTU68_014043 [Idotea baltica]|nr:hypothetical protein [Idotea baltica]
MSIHNNEKRRPRSPFQNSFPRETLFVRVVPL